MFCFVIRKSPVNFDHILWTNVFNGYGVILFFDCFYFQLQIEVEKLLLYL